MGGLVSTAQADLLLYEPFAYDAGADLNGLSGGTGFASGTTRSAVCPGGTPLTPFVKVYAAGSITGLVGNDGRPNTYTDIFAHLPSTGNFVGPNNRNDHEYQWRKLDPTVTAQFATGNTTWFSFASARSFNTNNRAPSFTLGSGILDYTTGSQRGSWTIPGTGNTSAEAIAVGGTTPGVGVGGGGLGVYYRYNVQFFDSTRNKTTSAAYSPFIGATAPFPSTTGITTPGNGDHGYWFQYGTAISGGYSSAIPGDNESRVNITVGRIQWGAGAGGEDIVSWSVFHDKDLLTEANFNTWAGTWQTPTASAKSTYNYLSLGGNGYFVDELRIGTTFNDALGVPEPGTLALLAAGFVALAGWMIRRRK